MRTDEMIKQTKQTHFENPDLQAENLSALIDGELSDDAARLAIKRLAHNEAERARYAEYIAIGEALRGLGARPDGFSQRVMAALENEPVILAPMRKPRERHPGLWLAAATAAAITWGLWQSNPHDEGLPPMAAVQLPATQSAAMPYLDAHQDFAQAVISAPEMRFSKASLEIRQ